MSAETVGTVHGDHHTYEVRKDSGILSSPKFYVVRDDGKSWGSFSSKADAFRRAHNEAGPNAFER